MLLGVGAHVAGLEPVVAGLLGGWLGGTSSPPGTSWGVWLFAFASVGVIALLTFTLGFACGCACGCWCAHGPRGPAPLLGALATWGPWGPAQPAVVSADRLSRRLAEYKLH